MIIELDIGMVRISVRMLPNYPQQSIYSRSHSWATCRLSKVCVHANVGGSFRELRHITGFDR